LKKLILFLIILAGVTAGCKLAGDFAIVKRQHATGYYIQTPSFVKKSNKEPISGNFQMFSTPTLKSATSENQPTYRERGNTNFQTTETVDNTKPVVKLEQTAKTIQQTILNDAPQYTIKPIAKDTIKKRSSHSSHNTSSNGKKMDWVSLTAFILSCSGYLLLPFLFIVSSSNIVIDSFLLGSLFFPLLGIIFGSKGKRRIKTNPEKYNGIRFAKTAIIMGILYYILGIVAFILGGLSTG
jgi:hypothetical protein